MRIEETVDTVEITFTGFEKIWALKSRFSIPKSTISDVSWHEDWLLQRGAMWWRLGGSYLPGVLMAGRYYGNRQWLFAYIKRPNGLASIRARDVLMFTTTGRYKFIAVTCRDESTARQLTGLKGT